MYTARFENFNTGARLAVLLARGEALGRRQEFIGTEHFLLAFTSQKDLPAAIILLGLEVDLDKVRSAIESIIPLRQVKSGWGDVDLSPNAQRVCEIAAEEAEGLEDDEVGTEHLLLALLKVENTIAELVLTSLKMTLEQVRAEITKIRSENVASS